MPPPLILRILGDATSYFKTAESTIATNTKLASSFGLVGRDAKLSADAQIAAAVKAQKAQSANLIALQAAQAKTVAGSRERVAANLLVADAQSKLNRSLGVTTGTTGRFGQEAKTAERDLNKMTRGVLSGSGALTNFGRSLAFASSGFLGFAIGASVVAKAVTSAEDLEKAQRSLDVAISHTGGNLEKLRPRYAAIAKEAAQFGVSEAEAMSGLARATVLTGSAEKAQRAYQEALVISKATGKDFNAVLIATSKGQEGITTSLRRYGILVDSTTSGTAQFAIVMKRFGGQAAANTTELDKLHANLANTEAAIGQELLPTVSRLAAALSAWLQKMNETGRLQRDVNSVVKDAGDVFHVLGDVIGVVDKVTGSFGNTLKTLLEIKVGFWLAGWIKWLDALIVRWGLVGAAATKAARAETAATATGGLAGAAGIAAGAGAVAISARTARNLPSVFGEYAGIAGVEGAGLAAVAATSKVAALRTAIVGLSGLVIAPIVVPIIFQQRHRLADAAAGLAGHLGATPQSSAQDPGFFGFFRHPIRNFFYSPAMHDLDNAAQDATRKMFEQMQQAMMRQLLKTGTPIPKQFQAQGFGPFGGFWSQQQQQATQSPFGPSQPISVWASFQLTMAEQIAQAEAALTKSTKDDVATAKQIVARIKRLIDEGHLSGKSLLEALQAEASALGTIQSAGDAAKARAQAAAAARLAARSTYEIPGALQLAQAKAEAYGKDQTSILKKIIAAAQKAIDSGKKNWQGLVAAYQVIASAQAQLNQQATSYTLPLKLQLQLARAQATNADQTPILLRMRAALYKALKAAKGNIEKQIDIWNQIAGINSQLQNSVTNAYGAYKKASVKAETAGLGLTAAERRILEQRLSRRGPGGTVPSSGVGAGGYIIDPDTGRPIKVKGGHYMRSNRRPPIASGGGGPAYKETIIVKLIVDGKQLASSTTVHQQGYRRRNPSSRRGPNAGSATA